MSTIPARCLVPPPVAVALSLSLAALAGADEVLLKTGGRISGVVVERTAEKVVIETGPGRVTMPMSRVDRIVESDSALAAFRQRAAGVAPTDARGWAELARWAEGRDLTTQAREAWERVLELEPGHPQANAALGRTLVDGKWMSTDDAYRAQGYVRYDGRWVTPAEHEALLREREAEDAERRERHEAQARVREAEARADEAEARARDAAARQADDGSIPYWWGYGGGGLLMPPLGQGPDGPSGRPDPPARPPARPPVTTPPPRTIGGSGGQHPTSSSGVPAPATKPSGGLGPAPAGKPKS